MASSGLRKEIWARRGFDERMQYSEDDEHTGWCRAQGWRVVYVPESVVMHSHDYAGPLAPWTRSAPIMRFGAASVKRGLLPSATPLLQNSPNRRVASRLLWLLMDPASADAPASAIANQ